MSSSTASNSGSETRRTPRKTLKTLGDIVVAPGAEPLECNVLDLSSTGARLSLTSPVKRKAFEPEVVIPAEFCLQVARDNIAVDCRVVRRNGKEVGVEFTSAFRQLKRQATARQPALFGGLRKPR